MAGLIGLDFETYGSVSLPKHGLARYVADPNFQALIGSVACEDSRGILQKDTFDFTCNRKVSTTSLREAIGDRLIVAHNAGFEQAVLDWLGLDYPSSRFIDSAVVARAAGAGGGLAAAAPQLLGVDKMASGMDGIKLFSMPGLCQEANEDLAFDPKIVELYPDQWTEFIEYCELDATLSFQLAKHYMVRLTKAETEYMQMTMDMNRAGWTVDIESVEEMHRRYLENQDAALAEFRATCASPDLNLNSLKQMKEWCADRGVKATSFDEKHVAALLGKIEAKLQSAGSLDPDKAAGYAEVMHLLQTKQVLGGSSLKKLQVILDTAADGKLMDQYLHCGAGQSLRTTGRSVQMQNLKRLADPADMSTLADPASEWDNTTMAQNLRQVFTSSHKAGRLIVGDFSSVESRGLAWAAGEQWKLDGYHLGYDMYKQGAAMQFGVTYEQVTKEQRQFGKVGELSCGYQAGPDAVKDFAEKMGVILSEAEATKIVWDWRDANPAIVAFWDKLDQMLNEVVDTGRMQALSLADGYNLYLEPVTTPKSLHDQVGVTVSSIEMRVHHPVAGTLLKRYFHGCYRRGRNVAYHKPSDRKTGDLWKNHYVDPKTKQIRFFELYGGKLAGILTQSLCREIFMRAAVVVAQWCEQSNQLQLVGQFHDELVVDWVPTAQISPAGAKKTLKILMSDAAPMKSFPLAAEVHSDYRYIK
jgi:DNA polymerase